MRYLAVLAIPALVLAACCLPDESSGVTSTQTWVWHLGGAYGGGGATDDWHYGLTAEMSGSQGGDSYLATAQAVETVTDTTTLAGFATRRKRRR